MSKKYRRVYPKRILTLKEQLTQILTLRGYGHVRTSFDQAHSALGLRPAERGALLGALQELDRERHFNGERPLSVVLREGSPDEMELTRSLLVEFGYLREHEDAEPVRRKLRSDWRRGGYCEGFNWFDEE